MERSVGGVSLVLVWLIFTFNVVYAAINDEGGSLHTFKLGLTDPSNNLLSWNPNDPNPCQWFHVTCNVASNVIRVDLGNAGLSGPLVRELGKLKNLQALELFGNSLTGKIPVEFGNLASLVSLDLFNNRLTGGIPSTLGKLSNLKFIRLNNNQLSGSVPTELIGARKRWGNKLKVMDFTRNRLTGPCTQQPCKY